LVHEVTEQVSERERLDIEHGEREDRNKSRLGTQYDRGRRRTGPAITWKIDYRPLIDSSQAPRGIRDGNFITSYNNCHARTRNAYGTVQPNLGSAFEI